MERQKLTSALSRRKCLMVVHSPKSDIGRIGTALLARGYELERCCPIVGDRLPNDLERWSAIVVFGGAMSANDEALHEGIFNELRWLPTVVDARVPFLGVCLGAQLMARALGATVAPHPKEEVEVGYYPVIPTEVGKEFFSSKLYVYQWHKEGFDLPRGAELLAHGRNFPNQACRFSADAFGIQFHPEITWSTLKSWCSGDTPSSRASGAQSSRVQLEGYGRYDHDLGCWLEGFIEKWLANR